jgi:L-fucose mutarotase/ribose pyranase (RbsD/FucU family)
MVLASVSSSNLHDWELELHRLLPLFGHRNWIVVADAAYPAQSNPGIETVVAGADQKQVVRKVQDAIAACNHIRANIYTDLELGFVKENDAPGIAEYRRQLDALLDCSDCQQLPHRQIVAKLDQCAQRFRILIVKTDLTIPYTSVFFELDCGYWSAEAEQRLRQAMLPGPAHSAG